MFLVDTERVADFVQHRFRWIKPLVLLREISDFNAAANFDSAACFQLSNEDLQERRLPRAVFADERNAVSFADEEGDAVQHGMILIGERNILHLRHTLRTFRRRTEREVVERRGCRRQDDAFQTV